MGITMMRETEWDWFTSKEMNEVELTPEGREEVNKMWDDVLEAAKAHGGLKEYGEYLLNEKEKAHNEFCQLVELAIPTLTSNYSWYIQGHELIGADQYGNQSVIVSFHLIRKKLEKGLSILSIVNKEIDDLNAYWEE